MKAIKSRVIFEIVTPNKIGLPLENLRKCMNEVTKHLPEKSTCKLVLDSEIVDVREDEWDVKE